MTQSNFKYFFVIITITLFLILLYSYYNFYIPNKISVFYINKTKCNPLKDNSKQFKIKINNEYYPKSVTLTRNKSIDFACLNTYSVKRILFWNSFFGREDYNFGIGRMKPFAKNRCPVLNCEITTDKSKLNQSNYVITHMRSSFQNIPNSRPFNQKWIFMLLESPVHASDFKPYKNLFNLTYTYKRDSNFPGGYEMLSYMYWEHNDVFNENLDFHKEKTDFSAAVISNCASKSPRLRYINQLRNYISVDLFGKCGKNCPIYFRNTKIKGDCKEIIGKSYKFYFAFENSICNDYITEKFFHILRYNIIPVVMGGGNYDYYVNELRFKNIKTPLFSFIFLRSLSQVLSMFSTINRQKI